MSFGNTKSSGNKGNNYPFQYALLQQQKQLIDATSASTSLYAEQDFGAVTGTTITLSHIPTHIYGVFKNGQRLTFTTDYSIVGTVITFINPLAADLITVTYNY